MQSKTPKAYVNAPKRIISYRNESRAGGIMSVTLQGMVWYYFQFDGLKKRMRFRAKQ